MTGFRLALSTLMDGNYYTASTLKRQPLLKYRSSLRRFGEHTHISDTLVKPCLTMIQSRLCTRSGSHIQPEERREKRGLRITVQ